ncbi:sugar phosphate nucleotidyltransferase [Spirochaetota bacterium]
MLAGGKGERMKSELPKVLQPLQSEPLISHVIGNLKSAGIENITVVVGYRGDMVIEKIGPQIGHVWQHEQLGTGHAVMQAEEKFSDFDGNIIVACGDVPLIKPETFELLIGESQKENVKAVVLTMEVDNPGGYGRILKDGEEKFIGIVEEADASDEEKSIKEVNTGTYIFDKEFLFNGLKQVDCNNAQNEYYLPDALEYVIEKGYDVGTLLLKSPIEGSGINSKEELSILEEYLKKNK